MFDLIISNEEDMVDCLEYLSPLGASDHKVLTFQFNCEVICEPLTILFDKSIETGIVPDEWKKGQITALLKKGRQNKHQITDQLA